jgi:5-formyltetrahydrofolate cyclo-ligase
MTKAELRKIYLQKMQLLSPVERAEKSERISENFIQQLSYDRPMIVHCFIAIEKFNEIDTTFIFRRLWKEFPQIITVVPRVDLETGEMSHLKFTPDTELVKNLWNIYEPEHDEFVEPGEIDVVLVPLLCIDRELHRVGYGKGFYDRFLAKCRKDTKKTGLSFFEPVDKIDDVHEGDVALDMCITPDKTYHR